MKYFIVDAFADVVFSGNPAGVCIVEDGISDVLMQNIARENNLSETAFVLRKSPGNYDLRWFTPKSEIDLCGHATLASAYVVSNFVDIGVGVMDFNTLSGVLRVVKNDEEYVMNFPSIMPKPIEVPEDLESILGVVPVATWLDRDLIVLVKDISEVKSLSPDFLRLGAFETGLGVIVTAKGEDCDFVSRCFYPKLGVAEDPVTGSAHSFLAPIWSEKLEKKIMTGRQLSERGGVVKCEIVGDRVFLSGNVALYLKGEIFLDCEN